MHGLTLQLDHIADPNLDFEDNLGDGAFDLSRQEIWGNSEGRERLELELADRMFDHRVAQDLNM